MLRTDTPPQLGVKRRLLAGGKGSGPQVRPPGLLTEARSHNAVVAAVAQGRADWGVAIATVARSSGLGFLPLQQEQDDFAIPRGRWDRPAVQQFRKLLAEPEVRRNLERMRFIVSGPASLTPARNRCVAVVCRIVCGLTPLPANDGIVFAVATAYRSTSVWMPNRVSGCPRRLRNTR